MNKNYKITLEDKNGKSWTELVSTQTFPEAVRHAYLLRSTHDFKFEIISVKKIKQ